MKLLSINPEGAGQTPSFWKGGVFEILFILIIFICILFLAYVVTRFVAGRASARYKSRHIEVLDTLSIGADAQLVIFKIGGEFFLASKSQKQFSVFSKLDLAAADFDETAAQTAGFAESFRSVLESKLGLPLQKRPPQSGRRPADVKFRESIDRIKDLSGPAGDGDGAGHPGGDGPYTD